MAFKKIGTSIRPLTRELAEDFATMPHTKTERPFREERVEFLSKELDGGRFMAPRWAVAYIGNERFRINGQHSSHMLANANGHFPDGLDVIVDEWDAEDSRDLAELFNLYDRPESNRTTRELFGIRQSVEPALAALSTKDVMQVAGGIAFATDPHSNSYRASDRVSVLHYHQDFIVWCEPFSRCRKLCRVPVLACIWKSWKKSPEKAAEFWKLVQEASHPDPKHPTRSLSDLLLITAKRGGGSNHQRWNKFEVHVKCIRAWNAWRTNQPSTLMKVLAGDIKNFPELD